MTIQTFYLPERGGVRRGRMWQSAPWERFEGRGVIATAIALAALAASATAGGAVVSGAIGAHAAGSAAQVQAKASSDATAQQLQYEREALAAQTKATDDSLAYTKQQAGQNRADAETTRQGDYEQWAAREGRLSTIGGMLGMPARQIPGYRALGPEQGAAGPGGAPAAPAANLMPKQGEVNWQAPPQQLGQQLAGFFQSRGVAPSEVPYWVGKAGELVTRGQQLNDPQYADKRLAAAEIFGGGGGAPAAGPQQAPYGSIAAMNGAAGQPLTAAYRAPQIQMPGSIRSMSQMAA